MNYRKFHWYNTHFSYAGVGEPAAGPEAGSPDFDDRTFLFTGDRSGVSGQVKEVPDLPVVVVAEDRVTLPVLPPGDRSPGPRAPRPQTLDRERFNDYGIGMLLQGDLVAAKQAFETVVALDPKYADGYVNIARVLIQEGSHEAARPVLERALALRPELASGHYFMALEAAQAITGPYRRLNAEMNLERQPIHEHPNRFVPDARAASLRPAAPAAVARSRRPAGR